MTPQATVQPRAASQTRARARRPAGNWRKNNFKWLSNMIQETLNMQVKSVGGGIDPHLHLGAGSRQPDRSWLGQPLRQDPAGSVGEAADRETHLPQGWRKANRGIAETQAVAQGSGDRDLLPADLSAVHRALAPANGREKTSSTRNCSGRSEQTGYREPAAGIPPGRDWRLDQYRRADAWRPSPTTSQRQRRGPGQRAAA